MITGSGQVLVESVHVDQIVESPTNPRKTFPSLEGLADDIAQRGILQPVLVRRLADESIELIVGACRFRAAKMAGLTHVPCLFREMSDQEVLETQIVENAARSDISPLEEADAYKRLVEVHHVEVEEIARRVGRSVSSVYGRLKLTELGAKARQALEDGDLLVSVAMLIARIPSEKLQDQAVDELKANPHEAPVSYKHALELVEENYMLRLDAAGWDLDDESLVKDAGSCSACEKRTGNQRELFADVARGDLCTDPPCFEKKRKAHGKRTLAGAKQSGQLVIPASKSKAFFTSWGHSDQLAADAPYVKLDSRHSADPKNRTLKKLFGAQAAEHVVLTTGPSGEVVELVAKKGLAAALRKVGHDFRTDKPGASPAGKSTATTSQKGASPKLDPAAVLRFEDAFDARVARLAGELLQGLRADDVRLWRVLTQAMNNLGYLEAQRKLVAACLPVGEADDVEKMPYRKIEERVHALIEEADADTLRSSCILLAITGEDPKGDAEGIPNALSRAVELFGIDLAQVEQDLVDELKALEPPAAPKASKKKTVKKKKPAPKGVPA